VFNIDKLEVEFVLETVRQATLLVKQVQAELVTQALTKDDRSPVTVADFAAQALVASRLMQAFPNDPLIGEEDSGALRAPEEAERLASVTYFVSRFIPGADEGKVLDWIDHGRADSGRRYWTVDPIDGTKGFLRHEQYAVALALVVDGEVQVGALGCPNLVDASQEDIGGPGSLVVAVRGEGAWSTPVSGKNGFMRLHVSEISQPSQARILRSVESGHTNVSQLDVVAEAMGVEAQPVRLDSQAKYAMLASGAGDLYFRLINVNKPDYREKIWDQAAGLLVAEEAGGKVTDLDGKPLDFTQGRTLAKNRGVLASNGKLHQVALQALSAAGA
jgi:HAL2 family 3'(2'),5'-bisphosphate nucleotidase